MIVTAFFGMASKFVSCTLAVMYRRIHPDGRVSGGPMYYLEQGLKEKGLGILGRVMAVIFAVLTVGGSLGIGNMFQVNQTVEMLGTVSEGFKTYNWVIGLFNGRGGSRCHQWRNQAHGTVTAGIVPFMCGLYVLTSFLIILAPYYRIAQSDCKYHFPGVYTSSYVWRLYGGSGSRGTQGGFFQRSGVGFCGICPCGSQNR